MSVHHILHSFPLSDTGAVSLSAMLLKGMMRGRGAEEQKRSQRKQVCSNVQRVKEGVLAQILEPQFEFGHRLSNLSKRTDSFPLVSPTEDSKYIHVC